MQSFCRKAIVFLNSVMYEETLEEEGPANDF